MSKSRKPRSRSVSGLTATSITRRVKQYAPLSVGRPEHPDQTNRTWEQGQLRHGRGGRLVSDKTYKGGQIKTKKQAKNGTALSVHAMKTYGGVEVWRWLHSLFSVLGKRAPQRVLTLLKGENISGNISSFLVCLTLGDGTDTVPKRR